MLTGISPIVSDDYSFQMLNPGMFSITLQPEEIVEGELIFMPTEVWFLVELETKR